MVREFLPGEWRVEVFVQAERPEAAGLVNLEVPELTVLVQAVKRRVEPVG